jgi:CBS domain containing-hemolysin-like protein
MLAVTAVTVDLIMLGIIVVLLVIIAGLALSETALTRMNRSRAAGLRESGRPGADRLLRLVKRPEHFLNALLFTILLFQTAQTALTTVLAERVFGAAGVIVALLVNVGIVFVFSEAAPKTWAIQHVDEAALRAAGPISTLARFAPLRWTARGLIGIANAVLPGKGLESGPFVSEEEFLALADEAAEAEVIEAEERVLINRVIDFGDTVAREVMVPRTDMVTVDASFRVGDAMEVVLLNGFSRIPVCGDGIDDVVGVLYAKDLMRADRDGREDVGVATLSRPAHFVPETKRVSHLLREMQAEKFHMAIVIDEYGGTAGLVTLEDLIEELVGEIVDEFDVEDPMIEPLVGGVLRVNGRLAIDEANEVLDGALPEGDWDTVGGLMFSRLGHVASEGDCVRIEGFELRADKMQGRRISRVRITPIPGYDDGAGRNGGPGEHRG